MTLLYTVAVFLVLLFLLLSTGAYWLAVYERGKTRVNRQ